MASRILREQGLHRKVKGASKQHEQQKGPIDEAPCERRDVHAAIRSTAEHVRARDGDEPGGDEQDDEDMVQWARGIRLERVVVHDDQVNVHEEAPAVCGHVKAKDHEHERAVVMANEVLHVLAAAAAVVKERQRDKSARHENLADGAIQELPSRGSPHSRVAAECKQEERRRTDAGDPPHGQIAVRLFEECIETSDLVLQGPFQLDKREECGWIRRAAAFANGGCHFYIFLSVIAPRREYRGVGVWCCSHMHKSAHSFHSSIERELHSHTHKQQRLDRRLEVVLAPAWSALGCG